MEAEPHLETTGTEAPRPVLERILRPPLHQRPFWVIQVAVLVIVGVHFALDVYPGIVDNVLPTSIPVAILVLPIGYAALRYGLAGSVATTVWSILLWMPDLFLPHDEGHAGDDLFNFAIIAVVAIVFGRRVEVERLTQARADEINARTLAVQAGYRRLFESSRSPILVLDQEGCIVDANPAATALDPTVVGRSVEAVLGTPIDLDHVSGHVVSTTAGRDYRLDVVTIAPGPTGARRQVTFEDVTEERTEERRARQFAQQIVQVEEDQRRRLARELHDEPLQLFLHLARRLESLSSAAGVPTDVAARLAETRNQALDAATRLRSLARDLRPPALDQLGLVPALSSLVAELEDEEGLNAHLEVQGTPRRLHDDVGLVAFRIVQESLRNIRRHAAAHEVRVVIGFDATTLRLSVVDDGIGFDTHRLGRRPGEPPAMGMVGMRERARLLGGTLVVRSTPGVGTAIEVDLPLEPAAPPAPGPPDGAD